MKSEQSLELGSILFLMLFQVYFRGIQSDLYFQGIFSNGPSGFVAF